MISGLTFIGALRAAKNGFIIQYKDKSYTHSRNTDTLVSADGNVPMICTGDQILYNDYRAVPKSPQAFAITDIVNLLYNGKAITRDNNVCPPGIVDIIYLDTKTDKLKAVTCNFNTNYKCESTYTLTLDDISSKWILIDKPIVETC